MSFGRITMLEPTWQQFRCGTSFLRVKENAECHASPVFGEQTGIKQARPYKSQTLRYD
jgi:hypothetical protein